MAEGLGAADGAPRATDRNGGPRKARRAGSLGRWWAGSRPGTSALPRGDGLAWPRPMCPNVPRADPLTCPRTQGSGQGPQHRITTHSCAQVRV